MKPKIRLKGFRGDGEVLSFNEVFELRNGYTPSKAVPAFWDNGTIPWFRMEDIRTNGGILSDAIQHITPEAIKGSGLFKPFSYIIATTATIGEHAMLIVDSLANQRFTNLTIRKSFDSKFDPYYVYYYLFKTDEWCKKTANAGGLLAVNIKELMKQPIIRYEIDEQQAIASYFQHLDSLIQSTTKKIESLKQVKAASLQSMFPQEGETTPSVRFKGFEGEWEKVSFDTVFTFLKNNSYSRDQLSESEGEVKNIHYGDVLIKFGDVIDVNSDRLPYVIGLSRKNKHSLLFSLCDGDIIIADAAEDSTVGKCSEINNIGDECVVAGLHTIPCRPIMKFAFGYLGHYINSNSYHNQLLPLIQGSKISSISKSVLKLTSVTFPSFEEQQKIADYFTNLDTQITLQIQRLEKLKQIKSECLDNMFV